MAQGVALSLGLSDPRESMGAEGRAGGLLRKEMMAVHYVHMSVPNGESAGTDNNCLSISHTL